MTDRYGFRYWIAGGVALGLLALSCTALKGQDEELDEMRCPATVTASGSDRYQVWQADSLISEHTTPYKAIERGILEESRRPGAATYIEHDAHWRIECDADWAPDSAFVALVDSTGVWPPHVEFRYAVDTVGDTTWTWHSYVKADDADSLVHYGSGSGRQFTFSALLYHDDAIRFCDGWCGWWKWNDPPKVESWLDAAP